MRRTLLGLLGGVLIAALTTTAPASAVGNPLPDPSRLVGHQVAAVDASAYAYGGFMESLAFGDRGSLVASVTLYSDTDNFGQLYSVRADGRLTTLGPLWDVGCSAQLMGVAVDSGETYVIAGNWMGAYPDSPCPDGSAVSPPSGVYRLTAHGYRLVMRLPRTALPNGLLIHDGVLYVTDSHEGKVYAGPEHTYSYARHAWFSSPLLLPANGSMMGANGIAWHDGALYVTGYAQGVILRVPVTCRGTAGTSTVYAQSLPLLMRADGITFDRAGRLWVTVNPAAGDDGQIGGGALAVVAPNGTVTDATSPSGPLDYPTLDYPTQVLIGSDGTVFVSNGSFNYGTPTVEAFTS